MLSFLARSIDCCYSRIGQVGKRRNREKDLVSWKAENKSKREEDRCDRIILDTGRIYTPVCLLIRHGARPLKVQLGVQSKHAFVFSPPIFRGCSFTCSPFFARTRVKSREILVRLGKIALTETSGKKLARTMVGDIWDEKGVSRMGGESRGRIGLALEGVSGRARSALIGFEDHWSRRWFWQRKFGRGRRDNRDIVKGSCLIFVLESRFGRACVFFGIFLFAFFYVCIFFILYIYFSICLTYFFLTNKKNKFIEKLKL